MYLLLKLFRVCPMYSHYVETDFDSQQDRKGILLFRELVSNKIQHAEPTTYSWA